MVFGEDDPGSSGYYDASSCWATNGSAVLCRGETWDRVPVQNAHVYSGTWAAWVEWKSAPGGHWHVQLAGIGRPVRSLLAFSNLIVYLNGPAEIPAAALPRLRLMDAAGHETPP